MRNHLRQISSLIIIFIVMPFGILRKLFKLSNSLYRNMYSEYKRLEFKSCPSRFYGGGTISPRIKIYGGKFISIGMNVAIFSNTTISAWSKYNNITYNPIIIIGNDCGIGENAHITSINKIILGNGVLLGKNVTITDNSHGKLESNSKDIAPKDRMLYSKGPVIIEDNVWIGDKATILPNVIIGKGTIIGANTVVSGNIPPYSIVVGNPARILKILNDE